MKRRLWKNIIFNIVILVILFNFVENFFNIKILQRNDISTSQSVISLMEDSYYRKFKEFDNKFKQPIYRVERTDKNIALTFDINWAEKEELYEILNILDKYDVKGTFFIMGKWVIYPEGNEKKLKDIYAKGHEIGNHSFVHPDFKKITKERMVSEIKKTEEIIDESIGIKTKLFRFPSGGYTEDGVSLVRSLGYEAIQWDIDSVDWKEMGLEKEYNKVVLNVKSGSIILFHNDGKYTPLNLDRLIPELKSQGYNFVKVGDLIYKENYEIDNQGNQRLK